jgi:pyruvate dehydrogenase E1 component beta subunit
MYIDDRWLYEQTGQVPQEMYRVPIGSAIIRRAGSDVTVVASSWMASEALKGAALLAQKGIDAEVIDLRSVKPWDRVLVLESVAKTGHLVIADAAWRSCGISAEVAATVAGEAFEKLRGPIVRLTLPEAPAPTSLALERAYYPGAVDLVAAVERLIQRSCSKVPVP